MVFSTIGWVSFYLGIAGFSLATLLSLSAWLGVLLLVSSALVLNELGLSRWNTLVWLTTISALGAALVALSVIETKPSPPISDEVGLSPFLWGIGSVVSYSLVFAVRSSDFTWDLNSDLDVIKDGLAYLLPVLIMFGIGVTLYRTTGESNLADILAQTPSAGLGHVFLVLAVISPILTNFHSGTLALERLVPLNKRQGALLIGAIGFILGATRFDHHLLPFLDLLGAVLIPALVVMLLTAIPARHPSKMVALVAWLAGSAAALIFKIQGNLVHLVVGAVVSIVVLEIIIRLPNKFEYLRGKV
jgi:purine-cytosine permease-like protein